MIYKTKGLAIPSRDTLQLHKKLKTPHDKTIDIATIKVTDEIEKRHPDLDDFDLGFFAISEKLFPENTNSEIESGDDVLVIGYPRGFYIQENLYPIVRSSCIASKWGSNFDGFPCFILDRRNYPGSSGSLVISKPTNLVLLKGKILPREVKQFVFLGVYSGEPTPKFLGTDTSYVWYGNIIKDIIRGRN